MNNEVLKDEVRLSSGVSDFKELINGKYKFIDKSLLIQEIIGDGAKVILITRPRRFGKTLNLSMLYYFLQRNHCQDENLFKHLAVSKDLNFCEIHQNQYPVIFISFKDIKKSSYTAAYDDIVRLIKDLYSRHRDLLDGTLLYDDEKATFMTLLNQEGTQSDIESAIKHLSEYITRKFNKAPIILIDEYDTPIQEAYLKGYYSDIIDLMCNILGQALKDNAFINKAVLTGITRIAQESLFSGVNNLEIYSLLREKYGQYFGFTESEVSRLITETGQKVSLNAIKEWYNGYQIGKYILYNPWSIIGCLRNNGNLKPYWLNTSSNDLIRELLTKADYALKEQFEILLQGKTIEKPLLENLVFTNLDKKEETIWSLLLYTGYLNVLYSEIRGFQLIAKVSIPNKEVMYVYEEIVAGWFRRGTSLASYKRFIRSLSLGEVNIFKQCLSDYIMETGSYFDFNQNTPEKVFHSFMLGLVVGLKDEYIIRSNQESGLGRFDVIFIPKNKQRSRILLEFKTSETIDLLLDKAQEALEQIKDKRYIEIFKQHDITSILAIGLAFCGKRMELVYEKVSSQ